MHRAIPTEFTAVPSEVLCLFFFFFSPLTTPMLLSHIIVILAVDVCVTSMYDHTWFGPYLTEITRNNLNVLKEWHLTHCFLFCFCFVFLNNYLPLSQPMKK